MDRDDDIRAQVQPFIDDLYEYYEETDPSKGHYFETDKLKSAQHAIHIWWYIYGKLLLWVRVGLLDTKSRGALRIGLTNWLSYAVATSTKTVTSLNL